MVSINFKLTEIGKIGVSIGIPVMLTTVLQQCTAQTGIELGGIIAIRQGQVLKESDLVEDGDEIDIFPALSGG